MVFRYRVLDAASKSKDGFLEAEDLETARRGLELQGLFVVELGEADPMVLEELARQRAAEEAAKPPPPPPGTGPNWIDRLQELWNQPVTRGAVRLFMALGIILVVVQTVRTVTRPKSAPPEPVARHYQFAITGAVTPGQGEISFVFPEVPLQIDRKQDEIKSGPDGAFALKVEFSSVPEPRNLLVICRHQGFADRQVEVKLDGESVKVPSQKLVAEQKKPAPAQTAEQLRRQKWMAEQRELAKKREAARLLRKPPPDRRRR